ncbi:glycerol-3-phosphate acyltransferase [Intestinibacillus massiliensis]|uniref:glycerol-3-phosphate acyltransferase n=1 Tax=Intestinibacillus massiliensis TaxID=1871029 RepID=UPI000B363EAB|nr:glycerol-3-phosphate acyltransferase [Intestinibacillus massiliensis]MCB6366360.1 glycerol-3-phosphate acyltransferase [Intestinibacillus massiliensis]
MTRFLCLLIGYICGCFLTAEAVARRRTGKGADTLGSGNPGMANIASTLGVGSGLAVLCGDVLKTALACGLCRFLFFPGLGQAAVLYAGLGAVLGHNFPFWKRFKGGKGVAVTCAALVFFSPLGGVASGLAGLLAVVLTGYLPVGAVVIPTVALVPVFWFYGMEDGLLVAALAVIMLTRHIDGLARAVHGQEKRVWRRP